MDSIPADCIRIIYAYLPPIYKITFARTCKRICHTTDRAMRDICALIRAELLIINPRLYKIIMDAEAAITGGFLIGILLDMPYGDIDIIFEGVNADPGVYCPDRNSKQNKKEQFCFNMRSYCMAELYHKITRIEFVADVSKIAVRTHTIKNVIGNTIYIDTIYVNNIREHVVNYDLDFCKLYFDGALHVINPISIIKKHSADFKPSEYKIFADYSDNARVKICRKEKYIARGFTIG